MATKEKKLTWLRPWWWPVLFFLAALSASAHVPRLAETRVWLEPDFAPPSVRAELDFDAQPQGFYRPLCYELALNPSIDPDGRFGKGAFGAGKDLVMGAGHLLYNFGGTVGYGFTAMVDYEAAESIYGQQRGQLFGAAQGVGQTLYDVGGSIGYTLTGDEQYYGASADRLYGVTSTLTGGDDNSTAYRVGYTGAQIAALAYGGQALNAGRAGEVGLVGERLAVAARTAETLPGKLYHYTGAGNAESILQNGLGAGGRRTFATPAGNLSPIQAQIELALPANRGYPGALFEIDTARLQQLGINPAVGPQRIMSTPNAGGGGIEFIFNQPIPPSAIRQVPFP